MTLEEVGKIVGVRKSTVQKWETGDIENMRRDKIVMLAIALKISPLFIVGIEDEYDIKGEYALKKDATIGISMFPLVGTVRVGESILATENTEGYFPMDTSFTKEGKSYFFLKVKGDSMDLEFEEGSLLFIERTPCIENGEIGIVMVNGNEATVKRVIRNGSMITLIPASRNPKYMPQMIDLSKTKVEIIGKVKMAMIGY